MAAAPAPHHLIAARDAWLGASPGDRAALGPDAVAACGAAVHELVDRLVALGLPVAEPITPCGELAADVAAFAAAGLEVPPALLGFWRHVGRLSLVDRPEYGHVGFWADRGVQLRWRVEDVGVETTDAVEVESPADPSWLAYVLEDRSERVDEGEEPAIVFAPDRFHKDDISGGAPYALRRAADPWLASVTDFRWSGLRRPASAPPGDAPDLVSYLRSAVLEGAGFPGLLGDPAFERDRVALVDGLPVF